jgi:hypothetical protein
VQYVAICFFFGLAGGLVGRHKGSSFALWFLISAIVPFVGLAAAYMYRYESGEPLRRCPRCGRVRRVYDAICSCGEELDYPTDDELIEPDPQLRVKSHI